MSKDGLEGEIYEVSVLPNTATQLAKAIYDQKDLSREEAMEMAAYLDDRYKMTGNVAVTQPHQGASADLDTQIEQILAPVQAEYDNQEPMFPGTIPEIKSAIKNLIAQEVSEAYKKGYVDGGIGVINETN